MMMGGSRIVKLGEGDENSDQDIAFNYWTTNLWKNILKREQDLITQSKSDIEIKEEEESNEPAGEPLVILFLFSQFSIYLHHTFVNLCSLI